MDLYALRKQQVADLEKSICSDIRNIVANAKGKKLKFELYCNWKEIYIDSYDTVIVGNNFGDEWNIENLSLEKKLHLLHDMYHTY